MKLALGLTIAATAASLMPQHAAAESPWVTVVVEHPQADDAVVLLRRLATPLRERHGIAVWDPKNAAREFEATHSANPTEVSDDEIRKHTELIRESIALGAVKEYRDAAELMRKFYRLPRIVQDQVRLKVPALARDIFDQCMVLVRAAKAEGDDHEALERARVCIHDSPKERPAGYTSPPAKEAFQQVWNEIAAKGPASLVVEVTGATAPCSFVLNGQVVQQGLPFRYKGPAVPTRLQANCGRPGRVHMLSLQPGKNALRIDLRLERVLNTAGRLSLRYDDPAEEQQAQLVDGAVLASTLGSRDLLLIGGTEGGRVTFTHVDVPSGRVLGEAVLGHDATEAQLLLAAQSLAHGPPGDVVEHSASNRAASPARGGAGKFVLGGIGAAAGVTGSLVAWSVYKSRVTQREEFAVEGEGFDAAVAFARYDAAQRAVWPATLGMVSLSTGLPLLLPEDDGVPGWAWIAGGAGVLVAGAGTALWVSSETCTTRQCSADGTDPLLGQLVLLHALPLLAVPLTYALRDVLDDSEEHTVSAICTDAGCSLAVRGFL